MGNILMAIQNKDCESKKTVKTPTTITTSIIMRMIIIMMARRKYEENKTIKSLKPIT